MLLTYEYIENHSVLEMFKIKELGKHITFGNWTEILGDWTCEAQLWW